MPLRPYTREQAVYPLPKLRKSKFWPTVTRIDDGQYRTDRCIPRLAIDNVLLFVAYGDTHLVCTCDSVEEYAKSDTGAEEGETEMKISGGITSNT